MWNFMKYRLPKNIFLQLALVMIFPMYTNAQLSPGDLSEVHAHLEGLTNCTLCHTLGKQVSDQKCLDCHKELNQRILASKGYHVSSEVKGKRCVSCHNDHHGRNFQIIRFDQDTFDHRLTQYTLEGAHAKIGCRDCHQKKYIRDENIASKKNTFLGLETSCTSCHEDYHQKSLSEDCISCHDFNAFKPAPGFDHDNSRFKLLGKHLETDCEACHKMTQKEGKKYQQFSGLKFNNCVDCHEDVHQGKFGIDCKKCHSEKSFRQLISNNSFDHSLTDFALEGRHRVVACASCHKKAYAEPLEHRYCSNCHDDYHEGQFVRAAQKPDCSLCHTVQGFLGSTYSIERHQQSDFILKGAHLATPCFECHKKETKWSFRQIGKYCIDCHNDIHQGYIPEKYYPGSTCTQCHNEESWKGIQFDHQLTDFPLEGKHKEPSCRACHFNEKSTGLEVQRFSGLKDQCTHCHTDNHQNQFDINGNTDCLRCHDFNNWKAERFDHAKTGFPLEGKHAGVACADCHKSFPVNQQSYVLYKIKDFRCEACH